MTPKTALEQLVQDHMIQAGIGLAVAMNVWHCRSSTFTHSSRPWRVENIIGMIKAKDHFLISDPDNVLQIKGKRVLNIHGQPRSWKEVSRVAYIGAVVILAANAINIQRQLLESE